MAECLSTIFVEHDDVLHEVPCGKCAFCLVNKRSDWMFRIHHEMRSQQYPGWFLTLTYSEKKVPRLRDGRLTLKFKHVQLYLKKLRKRKHYCKYVCVGEYGPETQRPHYHMLLWTCCDPLELERVWQKGHIKFGSLTMASAMYTLKYIIQPKVCDPLDGREKTRAQFSKGLGIAYLGHDWRSAQQVYDWHNPPFGEPYMWSVIDGHKVALPRYYKNKIFTKKQVKEESARCKEEREKKIAEEMQAIQALGVANPEIYRLNVRTEQAKRIISKTKYNLTL